MLSYQVLCKTENVLKFLLFLTFVYLLLSLSQICYYSYTSYKFDCNEKISDGYELGGSFNTETQEICIFVDENNSEYQRILKHEQVHLDQSNRKGIFKQYTCDNKIGVFFNEFEAYFRENF